MLIVAVAFLLATSVAAEDALMFEHGVPAGVAAFEGGCRVAAAVPKMQIPDITETLPLRAFLVESDVCQKLTACTVRAQLAFWSNALAYGDRATTVHARFRFMKGSASADIFIDVNEEDIKDGKYSAWLLKRGVWQKSKDGDALTRFLMDAQRVNQ